MENLRSKYPSLPPNYVTLKQLQERRLKELQKEEEEDAARTALEQKRGEEEEMMQKGKENEGQTMVMQRRKDKEKRVSIQASDWPESRRRGQKWLSRGREEAVVIGGGHASDGKERLKIKQEKEEEEALKQKGEEEWRPKASYRLERANGWEFRRRGGNRLNRERVVVSDRKQWLQRKEEEGERRLQEDNLKEEPEVQKGRQEEERNVKAFDRPEERRNGQGEIGLETKNPEGEVEEENCDQKEKINESKKSVKKNKRKKTKVKAGETQTGKIAGASPEKVREEEIPTMPMENPNEERRTDGGFHGIKGRAENFKGSVDEKVEIEGKFGDLALVDDDEKKVVDPEGAKAVNGNRSRREMNGGDGSRFRRWKRLGGGGGGKAGDGGVMVWVKKGEVSDGIPARSGRSSGGRAGRF
ncbi:PREDICTED: golgin subfamily A member 6-like protein 22 [Nelumbo nucifera]|uniref:Golgin subfamily A member 6-like protein 22 n=2 Tax=Nelumbo nucifera TaxID=4432 RepID=A0A1U7Z8A3_NELNU|nr:PREDICTED: golgin subfamily A member 6-like protein 22 [Nelumbo nucifera]DAD35909.1 TPA_asm: hypothetical protein HUJ06_006549 [Nelumbo nucifera]